MVELPPNVLGSATAAASGSSTLGTTSSPKARFPNRKVQPPPNATAQEPRNARGPRCDRRSPTAADERQGSADLSRRRRRPSLRSKDLQRRTNPFFSESCGLRRGAQSAQQARPARHVQRDKVREG